MATDAFTASPLITPERLQTDLSEALRIVPKWVSARGLALPGLPLEDNVLAFALGEKREYAICPVAGAFLFEVTRYGGSVVVNSRVANSDEDAPRYLKLTTPGADKDYVTVARLVMDAQPVEAIIPGEKPRDLRAGSLTRRHGMSASKSARVIAMVHAERRARKHGVDPEPYLGNLRDLLDLHDKLHMTDLED